MAEAAPEAPGSGSHRDSASDEASRKRRRRRRWAAAIATALVVCALVYWRRKVAPVPNGRAPPPAVPVTTVTARAGNIGIYLNSIGTVTPVHTTSVTSQVTGVIVAVHYREGEQVKKGDPLIDIDPRPYRALLVQAKGLLERDKSLLAQARMDLVRYRAALARNAIAEQIVADQEKLVLQDQGTVKNDIGAVQYDQVQLDFCHITSPIDGVVGLRLVDPGNLVQSTGGVTLAVVTQVQPITVVFVIAEDNLGALRARLRAHARLTVEALDRSNRKSLATGELLAIDNQIDTTTGTVKGRAVFENKDDILFPNQFVNTRLLLDTLKNAVLLPTSSIQKNGKASFVYAVEQGTVHVRSVTPGVTDDGMTQVSGIDAGEVVANSSFERLQDKSPVTVVAMPPPSAQTQGKGSATP